ncbi:MAG: GNAT family N-acetyltransferase [Thermomicrobiales bacterium]
MTQFTDTELYDRGIQTLIASWETFADGSEGAEIRRLPGVTAALFPGEPERSVFNNAVLTCDTSAVDAVDAAATAYAEAGITHYAAWIHENDREMKTALEQRGFTLEASTRAMGMSLLDLRLAPPNIELRSLAWNEYAQRFGLPDGLLSDADHSQLHPLFACLNGEIAATALAFDHECDCGIYNVTTLEHARRRGLGGALTALHLHDAIARGCETASLQSTPMAERVYAAAGFRDLGLILEYVPPGTAPFPG